MEQKYISKRIDVKTIISMLNKALKAEIYASKCYWFKGSVAKGCQRQSLQETFMKLANEEWEHAQLIKQRIIELDGDIDIQDLNYLGLKPGCVSTLEAVEFNIANEEEAMGIYYDIIQYTENKDHITCALATHLMQEESRHLSILCGFQNDFQHEGK